MNKRIAYFSMEFAFDDRFQNYAGGLGVLAADTMYSCADLGIPAVGVTLWYHQDEDPKKALDPSAYMKKRPETVRVQLEDRMITLGIWEYTVTGARDTSVPVLFLSSNVPDNKKWDRDLTKWLYASDRYTRLGQEALLGIGGYRALKACGFTTLEYYHMNEGHTALIGLERLQTNGFNYDSVRNKSTFTTHTPIAAGHDYFDYHLAHTSLGWLLPQNIHNLATHDDLGMTQLAMNLSVRTNAVSRKHRDVTADMFPGHAIEYVTNGIYHPRWIGPQLEEVFDAHLTGWKDNPTLLENIFSIPDSTIYNARQSQKESLINWINEQPRCFSHLDAAADDKFETDTLTVGFARRFVSYKRPGLMFKNIHRLRELGFRKVQFVFAGHCHPDDSFCNQLRDTIAHYDCELRGQIRTIVIPEYNLDIAKRLITGVDVWLNNPIPPREASGTSGMKAALNGALNLSILDGWWIEGYEMRPRAGWGVIGSGLDGEQGDTTDNTYILDTLADVIHCYHDRPDEWRDRIKHAIALGGYFNTHRMLRQYQERMWK